MDKVELRKGRLLQTGVGYKEKVVRVSKEKEMTTANNKPIDDNVAFRHNITAGDNVAFYHSLNHISGAKRNG